MKHLIIFCLLLVASASWSEDRWPTNGVATGTPASGATLNSGAGPIVAYIGTGTCPSAWYIDTDRSGTKEATEPCVNPQRTHATDCTAIANGALGEYCWEQNTNRIFVCEPTAGGCDTAAEWVTINGNNSGTINVADAFGCNPAAVGDDTACITALDAYAFANNGSEFYFPNGTYLTTVGFRSGGWNTFRCGTSSSCSIKAAAGYTATTPMISLDAQDHNNQFGVQILNMTLDGDGKANIGLYGVHVQEFLNVDYSWFMNFMTRCIQFDGNSQNFTLEHGECWRDSLAPSNFVGIDVASAGDPVWISHWTISNEGGAGGGDPATFDCIHLNGSGASVMDVHCELEGHMIVSNAGGQTFIGNDHRGSTVSSYELNGAPTTILGGHKFQGGGVWIHNAVTSKTVYCAGSDGTPAGCGAPYLFGGGYGFDSNYWGGEYGQDNGGIYNNTKVNERLMRPHIRDWIRIQTRTSGLGEDIPVCDSSTEGTIYRDSDLKEMCECSDESGAFKWQTISGKNVGTTANCTP